jgi:hypothetical protein
MELRLRRSQRDGGLLGGKVIFGLSARINPSAEESLLIKRYKLGKLIVYSSETHQKHADSAHDSLTSGSASGLAKGLARMGMMALSLKCTIDSLVTGQSIECQDLSELLGAEEAIVQACNNAKAFLAAAATFDGREVVLEI